MAPTKTLSPFFQRGEIERRGRRALLFLRSAQDSLVCKFVFQRSRANEIRLCQIPALCDLFDLRKQFLCLLRALVDNAAALHLALRKSFSLSFFSFSRSALTSESFVLHSVFNCSACLFASSASMRLCSAVLRIFSNCLPPSERFATASSRISEESPQPSGNGDRVAAAGYPERDLIERLQSVHVELHARILNPLRCIGNSLREV